MRQPGAGFAVVTGGPVMYNGRVSRVKRILRIVCGYTLLVLGFIGLFLPVLQGTLMIIAGAALLGWDLKPVRNAIMRLFPGRKRREG